MDILSQYTYEIPAIRTNLYRILNHGKLAGTGKIIILPVDQGFEHGPDASFLVNPAAYDPLYHLDLAIDSGVNAYAAPLGMLEAAAAYKPGAVPMILKLNSNNSLKSKENQPHQAITASVEDALKLGCIGVGFTIYPGSNNCDEMLEQAQRLFQQAKNLGLVSVIWSYPRGAGIKDEASLDTISYGAHIGALTGAHIIKVKLPNNSITNSKLDYPSMINLAERVKHIKKCTFNSRRIVLFSGGSKKGRQSLLEEIREIKSGGGDGSIIGRNIFQRSKSEAIELIDDMVKIYKNEENKRVDGGSGRS